MEVGTEKGEFFFLMERRSAAVIMLMSNSPTQQLYLPGSSCTCAFLQKLQNLRTNGSDFWNSFRS